MIKPTDSELSILAVLWNNGPSTVRFVNDQLNQERRVGYTNTLKMMQIMHEKGILSRDESSRSHVYSSLIKPEEVRKKFVQNMVNSIFEGNTSKLLVHALGNYKPSKDELKEIRDLLSKLEENEPGS